MAFEIVQLLYWLALATWFGSVLFAALAAPIIFRTVTENHPVLPHVLSVNLDDQHATLLAGSVVVNLVHRLLQVELVCAGLLLVAMIVQPFVIDLSGGRVGTAIVRTVLFLAAGAVAYYDWLVLWPRITASRNQYIDAADQPDVANPAKDRFDAAQRLSLTLLSLVAALLLGLILFSAAIAPKPTFSPMQTSIGG